MRKRRKDKIQWLLIEQGIVRHEGMVRISYKRFSPKMLDEDGLAASAKSFLDALVKCGIIEDDSPLVIQRPIEWLQEKGKARTEITIASLD